MYEQDKNHSASRLLCDIFMSRGKEDAIERDSYKYAVVIASSASDSTSDDLRNH